MWLVAEEGMAAVLSGMAAIITLHYHAVWHPVARQTLQVPWDAWLGANAGYSFGFFVNPTRAQWSHSLQAAAEEAPPTK